MDDTKPLTFFPCPGLFEALAAHKGVTLEEYFANSRRLWEESRSKRTAFNEASASAVVNLIEAVDHELCSPAK